MLASRERSVLSNNILFATLSAISIYFAAACSAHAQSREEMFAMQTKLQQEGYYKADIDGLSGPSTRQAISDYANAKRVENSFRAVSRHIYDDTFRRMRKPNEIELQEARELVRAVLKDGPAARFRDERVLETNGGVLVCGEVNGKNAYGAYAGFQYFSVTFSKFTLTETRLLPLGDPEFELAELFCLYGTSFGLAVIEKRDD